MTRQRRRRRRRARQAQAPAPVVPVADAPVNWSRLRQLFTNMSHRGTKLFDGYVLAPVVVDLDDPRALAEATEQAILEQTEKQQPS